MGRKVCNIVVDVPKGLFAFKAVTIFYALIKGKLGRIGEWNNTGRQNVCF